MEETGEHAFYGWLDRDPVAWHARRRPAAPAAVELSTGRRLDFRQIDERMSRMAGWLLAQGVSQGDRVAWLGRNCIAELCMMFACRRAGVIFTPLNWRLTGQELSVIAEDATPVLMLADAEFAEAASIALRGVSACRLIVIEPDVFDAEVDASTPAASARLPVTTPFVLLYTSGTTGRPKGAPITRLSAFFGGFNFSQSGEVEPGSVMLCDAPMFHTVGLMAVAQTSMQVGACVVMSDRFEPGRTLKALSDRTLGVTHYFAVPQIAKMLREHPDYPASDLSGLKALFTGGAPMPPALIEAFLDDGVTLANGYGMTEVGTVLCMPLDKDLIRRRLTASGLIAPAVAIRILRKDGADAAPGESGEIWLKGPGVMPGYWNRPDANAEAFVDGWFRTGDAGMVDEGGYYTLLDRWKDMYISGGENVYPAEVEAALLALPGVAEAAVVGVADARWGECGLAFVVAAPGAAPDTAALLAGLEGRLARYKHPREVRLVDQLPRTASGKIRKDELRAMTRDGAPA